MRISIEVPQVVCLEGIADEARMRVDGDIATAAVETKQLLTRRRLKGQELEFEGARWLITGSTISRTLTLITFRRTGNG